MKRRIPTAKPATVTDKATQCENEDALAIREGRLDSQAEQLAVVEERNRLARELHDSVTQSLYSATLFAAAAQRVAAAGDLAQTQAYVAEVAETTQQALKEMRLLVHKLRPSLLDEQGLVAALQHRLRAVEGRAGVAHTFSAENLPRFSHALEDAAYFIVQEALNNALRHAMATNVAVTLHAFHGALRITVTDNGCGFDPLADDTGGFGLRSMRERAAAFNGEIKITSPPADASCGTAVQTTLAEPHITPREARAP